MKLASEYHILHTNNALTLVPTRYSKSGHFEVTGKFLLAKQCLDSVALKTLVRQTFH